MPNKTLEAMRYRAYFSFNVSCSRYSEVDMASLNASCDNCGKVFKVGTPGTKTRSFSNGTTWDYCCQDCENQYWKRRHKESHEYKTSGKARCSSCGNLYDVKSHGMSYSNGAWGCEACRLHWTSLAGW